RVLRILPTERYKELGELLGSASLQLCLLVEPALTSRGRAEAARALVRFLHATGRAQDLLTELGLAEACRAAASEGVPVLVEDSLAARAVEEYLRMVADRYLQDVLGEFIRALVDSEEDCDVEVTKCSMDELQERRITLRMCCELVFCKILASR
ncbi:disabled homolog 2-interacting protein-like, partial [Lampetra fluviatilis]